MIIQLICMPLFGIVDLFLNLLPNNTHLPGWLESFVNVLSTGLSFFPGDLFTVIVVNVCFWADVCLIDAVMCFIIRKIPFVGIS